MRGPMGECDLQVRGPMEKRSHRQENPRVRGPTGECDPWVMGCMGMCHPGVRGPVGKGTCGQV